MLTQPVVFEHVQQRGFAGVIQAQEHKFSRLFVQTWKENKTNEEKTPAGLSLCSYSASGTDTEQRGEKKIIMEKKTQYSLNWLLPRQREAASTATDVFCAHILASFLSWGASQQESAQQKALLIVGWVTDQSLAPKGDLSAKPE